MADLITRLLLNTQQFDNNLGKSTKQIQGFQQKIQRLFQWCCQCLGVVHKVHGNGYLGVLDTYRNVQRMLETTSIKS